MHDGEHPLVTDAKYWSSSHPLLEKQNSPGFVTYRIYGEIQEFLAELDLLLSANPDIRAHYIEKAAREAADIGVFAIGLLLQLQHDPSILLHGLSKEPPPQISLPRLREKLVDLQQRYAPSDETGRDHPKLLDIYETIYFAWTAAVSLGRDYVEEYTLKSQYNHHRYPASEFGIEDLRPEEYHVVFQQRIARLKEIAIRTGAEEKFYQKNRKQKAPHSRGRERLRQYQQTAGMYIQAGISLITGLNIL